MAVDIETTGLDPSRDEVISFAAVPIERGRAVAGGAVGGLVRPSAPPPPASIEIHGLRARVPVAHAAWVERGFLAPHLSALGSRLPRRMVDTALLWRLLAIERGRGDPGQRGLGEVAADLGLPAHQPHLAEGDALTTAQAFLALATHLEALGRGRVGDLTDAAWQVRAWRRWHPDGLP